MFDDNRNLRKITLNKILREEKGNIVEWISLLFIFNTDTRMLLKSSYIQMEFHRLPSTNQFNISYSGNILISRTKSSI